MPALFDSDSFPENVKNVQFIIICFFIGVVLAAAVSLYHKHVLGSFIRFLRESGAHDESTAVRLDKTRFNKNPFVRAAILDGRTYSCVLRSVLPDDAPDMSKMTDKQAKKIRRSLVSSTGYYIPEDLSFRADNVFSKRGTTVVSAIIGIVVFVIVAAVSLVIVPGIVEMFKELTGIG